MIHRKWELLLSYYYVKRAIGFGAREHAYHGKNIGEAIIDSAAIGLCTLPPLPISSTILLL